MGLKIVVGAIKYSDKKKQDSVDKGIERSRNFDVKSKSALDFYNGLKQKVEDCREAEIKRAEAEGTEPDFSNCCIEHLTIDGHSTAGLGGKQTLDDLTQQQRNDIKGWLCKGATITVLGCFAFHLNLFPEYKLHLQLPVLLSGKGGVYEGYKSTTVGLYPDVESTDKNEKKTTKVDVAEGATEAEIKDAFKKVYPTGQ